MKLQMVTARAGAGWVRLGMRTFLRQPLALTGLFFLFMTAMTLISQLPLIGVAVAMVLLPGGTLGLMAATREATLGRFPMPAMLITGFRGGAVELKAMLALGGMYAGGFLVALGASWLVDGGGFARVYLGGQSPAAEAMMAPAFQGAMWVFIAIHLPVSLLFWHAPALVHWHGMAPLKSVFFSFVACLRNLRALLVFGLTWVLVLMLILLAVTLLASLLGLAESSGSLFFPALLLMAAMFFCSLYFSFRDTFESLNQETP
ncbi:MAG: BPSS1780 family membrane protein [Betaproteobacteria bacterium]